MIMINHKLFFSLVVNGHECKMALRRTFYAFGMDNEMRYRRGLSISSLHVLECTIEMMFSIANSNCKPWYNVTNTKCEPNIICHAL